MTFPQYIEVPGTFLELSSSCEAMSLSSQCFPSLSTDPSNDPQCVVADQPIKTIKGTMNTDHSKSTHNKCQELDRNSYFVSQVSDPSGSTTGTEDSMYISPNEGSIIKREIPNTMWLPRNCVEEIGRRRHLPSQAVPTLMLLLLSTTVTTRTTTTNGPDVLMMEVTLWIPTTMLIQISRYHHENQGRHTFCFSNRYEIRIWRQLRNGEKN